ncbi:MAG: DUF1828 domain-containing protein [Actinomycetota bacterium]|nr:DUF1828 domain-containing protein [Actinomycetota bacterium]
MTECSALLSSILAGEGSRWTCREVSADTVLLVTSHHYADGDTVELIVQTVGDEVIVSDGGEVLARLDSMGVNLDSQSRVGKSWKRLMAAHALEDDRGQLMRRASVEHTADLVQEMADAVANLDGLRLLAPVPRRPGVSGAADDLPGRRVPLRGTASQTDRCQRLALPGHRGGRQQRRAAGLRPDRGRSEHRSAEVGSGALLHDVLRHQWVPAH